MNRKYAFSSVAVQLAVACDFIAVYCIVASQNGIKWWLFPGVILLYAPLIYAVNRVFLLKERSLRSAAILNAVLAAAIIALCIAADGWCGFGTLIFMLLSVIWLTVQGAGFALTSPQIKHMLLCLDVTVLIVAAFAVYSAFFGLEAGPGTVMTLGFIAVCFGTAVRRCGRPLGLRGWLFTVTAFSVLALIMLFILGVAAASAGEGLVGIWKGLAAAAVSLDTVLLSLIQPFAALFPRLSKEVIPLQQSNASDAGGDQLFIEGSMVGMGSIMIVLGVILLIGAVFVIKKLGSIKTRKSESENAVISERIVRTEKSSASKLFAALKNRFRVYMFIKKNRDTAKGVYLYLVKQCRKREIRKKEEDTPREFLERLIERAEGLPEFQEALSALSLDIDRALYSRQGESYRISYGAVIRRDINRI